jgi:Protein of unknown function (DUF3014)
MTEIADFELDKPHDPRFGGRDRHLGLWLTLAVLVSIAVGVAIYFYLRWRQPQPAPQSVAVKTETAVTPERGGALKGEPGENIPLGPLDETDPVVRELMRRLSSHPTVLAWLATDQLVRNFTVSVVNVADGKTPASHLQAIRPKGDFKAVDSGTSSSIDPRSYSRYDNYADAFAALDARGAARLYATLKPRIQDAYRELGYGDTNFDATLQRAVVELLNTPVVDGSVVITPNPVKYEFSNPKLQGLSGAQRQLLRMGPRNVRLIQEKLREMSPYLGIAPSALPPDQNR